MRVKDIDIYFSIYTSVSWNKEREVLCDMEGRDLKGWEKDTCITLSNPKMATVQS